MATLVNSEDKVESGDSVSGCSVTRQTRQGRGIEAIFTQSLNSTNGTLYASFHWCTVRLEESRLAQLLDITDRLPFFKSRVVTHLYAFVGSCRSPLLVRARPT